MAIRGYSIQLPEILEKKLNGSECRRLVEELLASFSSWIARNETVFFREYTDHGPTHVEGVLETACTLMTDGSSRIFTAEDACLLVCSTIVHDCALHIQESGFLKLIRDNDTLVDPELDQDTWPVLWSRYLAEAGRLNQSQLKEFFGVLEPIPAPNLDDPGSWTSYQFTLIGEFLRRYHHRLAHEIVVQGIPGANGESPIDSIQNDDPLRPFLNLSGLIARSHGTTLRHLFTYIKKHYHLRMYNNSHPVYLMVLLRIADYLQMQSGRAPAGVARVKRLRSPISKREWGVHGAISDIVYDHHEDPETVEVSVDPAKTSIEVFLRIREWLDGVQQELDTSWAVLGEIYGRFSERSLGLLIRRVCSNIDEVNDFGKQAGYVPRKVSFSAADAELLKLLIKPLYGDHPEIAVRELVQNAVDAIRELAAIEGYVVPPGEGVTVNIKNNGDGTWSLIIDDTGIGMTFDTLMNYFLNAGASFRTSMVWKQNFQNDRGKSTVLRSGRFGVGALAAFLVADDPTHVTLRVTTRHCMGSAESALSFEAPLTDRPIAIRYTTRAKPGTRIEVITQSPPSFMQEAGDNKKVTSRWDWYCLDWPQVRRVSIDGQELRQEITLPGSIDTVPYDHHWIEPDGYAGVSWTYSSQAPPLVCNGIIVSRSQSSDRTDSQLEQVESSYGTLTVKMPALSVFDKDGKLPLTLDRLRVDYERITFLDDLRADVIRNIVAFLIVCAPEDLCEKSAFDPTVTEGFQTHPAIRESLKKISWLVRHDGAIVLDPVLAIQAGISSIVEFRSTEDARKQMCDCKRTEVGFAIVPESQFKLVSQGKLPSFSAAIHGAFQMQSEIRPSDKDVLRHVLDLLRGKQDTWENPVLYTRNMDPKEYMEKLEYTLRNIEKVIRESRQEDFYIHWLHEIWDRIRDEVNHRDEVTGRAISVLELLSLISSKVNKSELIILQRILEIARGNFDNNWDTPIRLSGDMDPQEFKDRLSDRLSQINRRLGSGERNSSIPKLLDEIWGRVRDELRHDSVSQRANIVLYLLSTISGDSPKSDKIVLQQALKILSSNYVKGSEQVLRSMRRMSYDEFEDRLRETLHRIEDIFRESPQGGEGMYYLSEIWDRTRDYFRGNAIESDRALRALDILSSVRSRKERRFVCSKHKEIKEPVLDWNSISRDSTDDSNWFVAEYRCEAGGPRTTSDGFFARIWNEHVGIPLIPHSLNERKVVFAHLWNNNEFRRHLEQWESVRSQFSEQSRKKPK